MIGKLAIDGWAVTFGTEQVPRRVGTPPSPLFAVLM